MDSRHLGSAQGGSIRAPLAVGAQGIGTNSRFFAVARILLRSNLSKI
jgi:hypothetical protein